tara:strand:+ start:8187 stop:9338 length:1152 start_codon:yes stop_codon:yes gene_type:complete
MPESFEFRLNHIDGRARSGELNTAHGVVRTPAFMPVGTSGAVKGLIHRDLLEIGTQLLLANTYHLYLRPGSDLIAEKGGLHDFIGWSRPMLTDSGGFQVFSLDKKRTISEEGACFRSHLDGSEHLLSPEKSVEIQAQLGADIAMAFDECTPYPVSENKARESMELTVRWGRRSRSRFLEIKSGANRQMMTNREQVQFGIIQGGVYPHLRKESLEATLETGFEGYALGGLSVGEPTNLMRELVGQAVPFLPVKAPRYLMGVGKPDDLVEMVHCGIDLFDCVLPTRNARNGQLFTSMGPINIKRAQYFKDETPPDVECNCYTCQNFTRAYLRHLFIANEMTAATLNTLHNLHFYLDTMRRIGEAIAFGSFEKFRQSFREKYFSEL